MMSWKTQHQAQGQLVGYSWPKTSWFFANLLCFFWNASATGFFLMEACWTIKNLARHMDAMVKKTIWLMNYSPKGFNVHFCVACYLRFDMILLIISEGDACIFAQHPSGMVRFMLCLSILRVHSMPKCCMFWVSLDWDFIVELKENFLPFLDYLFFTLEGCPFLVSHRCN